jgi:hypothetical protein
MSAGRSRFLIVTFTSLLAMLACVLPAVPVLQPAPTVQVLDGAALATIVSGTAAALSAQTAQAMPTPVPTATVELPAPTIQPTAFVSTAGSSLSKRPDGSTVFVDQRGGYQLVVPSGWLAVRINEQEFFDALTFLENNEPGIQRSLNSMRGQDPSRFRLYALDTQSGHVIGGFVTNMNFLWDALAALSLETDADLQAEAESLRTVIPGLELLTVEVQITPSGLQYGLLSTRWPAQTVAGASVMVFQKQAYVKFALGRLVITLSTIEELKDAVLPAFDAMIREIGLAAPQ